MTSSGCRIEAATEILLQDPCHAVGFTRKTDSNAALEPILEAA